jgi:hypothetical protein
VNDSDRLVGKPEDATQLRQEEQLDVVLLQGSGVFIGGQSRLGGGT